MKNIDYYNVFSDDLDWTRINILPLKPNMKLVAINKEISSSCKDRTLMSKCNSNIISNYCFSWWSAWLNPNPDKAIIAPAQWFSNPPDFPYNIVSESSINMANA